MDKGKNPKGNKKNWMKMKIGHFKICETKLKKYWEGNLLHCMNIIEKMTLSNELHKFSLQEHKEEQKKKKNQHIEL